MSIKITANSSDGFLKIEEVINKFDKTFIEKFNYAEYTIGGYSIQLTTDQYISDRIKLPKGFIIEGINNIINLVYEKNNEDIIDEKQKYEVSIEGTFQEQRYKLVYIKLQKLDISIGFN